MIGDLTACHRAVTPSRLTPLGKGYRILVSVFKPNTFAGVAEGDAFTGTTCRRLRHQWGIHMVEIASRAKVMHSLAVRWEKLRSDDPRHPFPFADAIAAALADRVSERALRQIEALPPAAPSDRERLRAVVARMNKEDAKT